MASQVPCLVFLCLIALVLLGFGAYYTYMYRKENYLTSCFHVGGKCLEVENCEHDHHYRRNITTCIHKRKVCCMQDPQPTDNTEDYRELISPLDI
ncbi:uncharacterized protein LOC110188745 [Drosophila serrata]|uniref:uncharacterized protein LOC110188745 n=1 Tax=Drosophila serrata TaxID=7274 RepID=UPI000A1D2DBE|nr:uncharacterized protein LOC110188745 [Drosophila serrata]KAH8374865.1 hypothetical protein KR200_007800 [Drosophila serrata]